MCRLFYVPTPDPEETPAALEEDSSVDDEGAKDGKTLLWSMALGSKELMPH